MQTIMLLFSIFLNSNELQSYSIIFLSPHEEKKNPSRSGKENRKTRRFTTHKAPLYDIKSAALALLKRHFSTSIAALSELILHPLQRQYQNHHSSSIRISRI
jgi:hypothetical protein